MVSGDKKIESKRVEVFGTYNDYYIISDGLTGNENIVIEGIQRIRPGAEVTVVETEYKSRVPAQKK